MRFLFIEEVSLLRNARSAPSTKVQFVKQEGLRKKVIFHIYHIGYMAQMLLCIIYIYICMSYPNVVEGSWKAPVLIATTAKCYGERYSFSWTAPLTLDPYLIMLSVKQGGIKYHF